MKKLLTILMLFAVIMSYASAKSISFNFSDVEEDVLMVESNTSQKTLTKGIKNSGSSLLVYTEVPFSNYANTMSIVFIEPFVIENISEFKMAKLVGKSLGYNASITLHFVNSKGKAYKIQFKDAVPKIPGEYSLEWTNGSYIEDVRDRVPQLNPIWPFNDSDMYLYEIEYHQNICIDGFPYNAQELVSLEVIYDEDTLDGNESSNTFEDAFGVEKKMKAENAKRTEKLKADKKAAEDREKARMATESFEDAK